MIKRVSTRLFLRTFFIQSLWNFERLQNIGFLYVLYPVFKKLYPDKDKRKEVLLRHIGFFNTNPYMANIIFAMVINSEKAIASGEDISIKKPEMIKAIMSGPIAAIGDSFFWGTWRPFVSFIAILLIILSVNVFDIFYIWIAPVAFIFLYNIVHLVFRYWILFISFRLDDKMISLISKLEISYLGDMFRVVGLVVIVTAIYFYFESFGFMPTMHLYFFNYNMPEAFIYGIILLLSFLFGKFRPVVMFYCAILFSFILGYLEL
ncbi:MAG: PTS system mannose/fructose/sorbose family transporter subunit IID [Endomicrobiia bacterium]